MAIQDDGKIVVVGDAVDSFTPASAFALARYNPNGSLDTSFSGDGKQTTSFADYAGANAVALQGDGKIVAVGSDQNSTGLGYDYHFALARYNPNGSLDPSFSGDGKQTTDFGGGYDQATAWRSRATARSSRSGRAANSHFALARYNPNGSLDPTFSGDGKADDRLRAADDAANGIAIQGDGKIVAVGHERGRDQQRLRPRPLQPRTAPSTRASPATASRRPASGATTRRTRWRSRADGKIVAVGEGRGTDGTSDFALARYLGG